MPYFIKGLCYTDEGYWVNSFTFNYLMNFDDYSMEACFCLNRNWRFKISFCSSKIRFNRFDFESIDCKLNGLKCNVLHGLPDFIFRSFFFEILIWLLRFFLQFRRLQKNMLQLLHRFRKQFIRCFCFHEVFIFSFIMWPWPWPFKTKKIQNISRLPM